MSKQKHEPFTTAMMTRCWRWVFHDGSCLNEYWSREVLRELRRLQKLITPTQQPKTSLDAPVLAGKSICWHIPRLEATVGPYYVLVQQDPTGGYGWTWLINKDGERVCENDIHLLSKDEAVSDVLFVLNDLFAHPEQLTARSDRRS